MRLWARPTPVAAMVFGIVPLLHAQARGSTQWIWNGAMPAGSTVTVDAVRADVRVLPARGSEVELKAVLHGETSAPESVTMMVDTIGDGVVIRTRYRMIYPAQLVRLAECLPSDSVHGNFWYSDVRADLTLRVPAGVRVAVRLMWGDIEARAPNAMELHTQNGTIN